MTPERADMIRATWMERRACIVRALSRDSPWFTIANVPKPDIPSFATGLFYRTVSPEETIEHFTFKLESGSYYSGDGEVFRVTCEGIVLERGIVKK